MYGMRTRTPLACKVTNPEYSPAAGRPPVRVRVSVAAAPAASDRLDGVGVKDTLAEVVLCVMATAKFRGLVPLLVTVTVLVAGSPAACRNPKESEDGSAVTVALDAAPASSNPAPVATTSTGLSRSSMVTLEPAELTSADLSCAPVKPG